MPHPWKEYQDQTVAFFREMGLDAQTDITIRGVRTSHAVDVLVRSHHSGFDVTWIVECKCWNRSVSKLHVLALREIVTDVGADRGILLSESGFQSGAREAATLTNVQLTSLDDLRWSARTEIIAMRLRELFDRTTACKERYWNIPKRVRIEYDLRPEAPDIGYAGTLVIDLANEILAKAFRGTYPIVCDNLAAVCVPDLPSQFATPEEILAAIEPIIADLEKRLRYCEENAPDIKEKRRSPS